MKIKTYIKRSSINASGKDVFDWHARDGAIKRLSPPWAPLKIISKTPGVDKGTNVKLKIKTGPVFSRWDAVHTACEPGRMFKDTQIKGPFKSWNHTHTFTQADDGTSILEDHVDFAMPFPASLIGPINRYISKDLNRIFTYRHAVTKRDLSLYRKKRLPEPLKIAITGASGLIGSRLVPFLSTQGHDVYTLVRRKTDPEHRELFWDPGKGVLAPNDLEGMDVVIHLAGENIGEVKWTDETKERLSRSRVAGTTLISETIAGLKHPPKLFLCASAIGFYGDTGENTVDETAGSGGQYISCMCERWEMSCEAAIQKGIRTVMMRIGVVYSPEGGALSKLLPLFKMGLGSVMGQGSQFISWISMEDVLHAMHHVMAEPGIHGPVNFVSPNPVSNRGLTKVLAGLLNRPVFLTIPAFLIRARFGQMGEEIVLSSARIRPQKLLDTGYSFIHPDLQSALGEVLGVSTL